MFHPCQGRLSELRELFKTATNHKPVNLVDSAKRPLGLSNSMFGLTYSLHDQVFLLIDMNTYHINLFLTHHAIPCNDYARTHHTTCTWMTLPSVVYTAGHSSTLQFSTLQTYPHTWLDCPGAYIPALCILKYLDTHLPAHIPRYLDACIHRFVHLLPEMCSVPFGYLM
jgi:hypothetical protein